MSLQNGPVELRYISRKVALYNILRDLGELAVSDVPPSFIEKFSDNSTASLSSQEVAEAASMMARVASSTTFAEFDGIVTEGVWPANLAQTGATAAGQQFASYASTMVAVIEASELQSVDREGLAALQYNWG